MLKMLFLFLFVFCSCSCCCSCCCNCCCLCCLCCCCCCCYCCRCRCGCCCIFTGQPPIRYYNTNGVNLQTAQLLVLLNQRYRVESMICTIHGFTAGVFTPPSGEQGRLRRTNNPEEHTLAGSQISLFGFRHVYAVFQRSL